MNYKVVFSILGKTMLIEALLMLLPAFVGVFYQDGEFIAFLIPILLLCAVGIPLTFIKTKDNSLYAKEGFVIVSLSWIVLSLLGALPFVISGWIPNYINAFFETVSGFTTTGASRLNGDVIDSMSKGMMFWRLFTHWIGGMGILVFVLAIMPANNAGVMHVFRTESPGPTVGKLASKLRFTARILYGMYIAMTVIEFIFLVVGDLPVYDALLMSFSTAGTGGFGIRSDSAISYSSYTQVVIAVFMFLFSINFNAYYFVLIGSVRKVFQIEEVRVFFGMVLVATVTIAINIFVSMSNVYATFGEALKHSFFQVASISSTTGLSSVNYDTWPEFSKAIIVLLTIVGACAGSTGGGMKLSRVMILCKSSASEFKRLIHPRAVVTTKFEGEVLDGKTERNVRTYFILWALIVAVTTLLLTLDGRVDLFSNFTATLACVGNVGPGLGEIVGPAGNYETYSYFSKILLSFVMLLGRLEIFPMLILFIPRTWRKG